MPAIKRIECVLGSLFSYQINLIYTGTVNYFFAPNEKVEDEFPNSPPPVD